MWLQEESCTHVVKEAWVRVMARVSDSPYVSCLEECCSALASWNTSTFGHVGNKIAKLQQSLQDLECQEGTPHLMADIENTRRELNRMLDMEEAMWH